MNTPRWLLPFVLAIAVQAAPSAPTATRALERDLGEGLIYFRTHTLPADLPTDESVRKRPCVLDLRYTPGDAPAAQALEAWLKFHASDRTPVFVLVNDRTSPDLLMPLAVRDHTPGLLVIGVAAERFQPDIMVRAMADAERRAYDALEQGASVAALTTDNPEKIRNDEASLSKDHAPDAAASDSSATPDNPAAGKKSPPIDAALQRAIHLHRALRAMKKI